VDSHHLYQFEHIGRGIFELIEGRGALLNQSLTQDQYRELTRKLCSRIDWGNRKLGLDLIPWNWLLEDEGEELLNNKITYSSDGIIKSTPREEKDNSLKILPECNNDAGKLFKLHQKSVESAATRGSSTLSRPKNKKEQKNNLYISLRDFSYTFTDDCEISFSLFDGKR
jgi:dedicator of cytokinesis protein 3